MSVSFPVKATFGVLAGGVTIAGGTLIYKEVSKPDVQSKEETPRSKKSVAELIKDLNKNKRLMNKVQGGNTEEGKEAWKLYATSYKNKNENSFSLSKEKPQTDPDGSEVAPDEFMNKCESFSRELVVDERDSKYQDVLKYCTRSTLVSDLIKETAGISLLEKTSNFAQDPAGKSSGALYKKDNSSDTDNGKLSNGSSIRSQEDAQEAFANACMEKSKVKEYEFTQPTYLDVLKYCTKAG